MADSSQQRVGRVRPPRVQITYDVEDGGATQTRELPMVAGVVSDLSGDATDPSAYAERRFVEVEQGGVDRLMTRLGPKLQFSVPNQLTGAEDQEIGVQLDFNSIDDFSPMGVAAQVPATAKLLEARRQLTDLFGKLEANEKLDGILGDVLADADKQARLRSALGLQEGEDQGAHDE